MRLEYYCDTSTFNERNNYTLMLDTPIQLQQNEYLEVKMVDLSFLNDNYNISENLKNNKITMTKEDRQYHITPGTIESPVFLNIDWFTGGGHQVATGVTREHFDGYELLTNENYKLYYNRGDILASGGTTHYIDQVFQTAYANSHDMPIEPGQDFSLVIEDINNQNNYYEQVDLSIYRSTTLAVATTLTLKVAYSDDGITYTDCGSTDLYLNTIVSGHSITSVDVHFIGPERVVKYFKFSYSSDVAIQANTLTFTKILFQKKTFSIGNTSSTTTTDVIIPDGFYNKTTFISTINTLMTLYNLTFSVSNITNKLSIVNNHTDYVFTYTDMLDENYATSFTIHNNLMKRMLGLNNNTYGIANQGTLVADDILNLLHYQKLIITTDLTFNQSTMHVLREWKDNNSEGLRNILLWCPVDEPPFSVIKYTNYENVSYMVDDKIIKNLNFYFYNEFKQPVDIKRILFHLQIEKKNISYK